MTDLRKAAELALEALETNGYQAAAITALREALAEPVQATAWAHLPNAAHIDRVLEHLTSHTRKWAAAWDAALDAAWDAALDAARDAARDAALDAAWDAALDTSRDAALDAAWDAIAALIAWDEAGDLLSLPPEKVKAKADEGDHAAVLLYPAMLAMGEKEK